MGSNEASQPFFDLTGIGTHDGSGASIVNQADYAQYEIAAGVIFSPVFLDNMSLNFVTFPADSGFPPHTHPEEQVSIVVSGSMEITVGDLTRWVVPGDVIVFPASVTHGGRTGDEPCRLIDIFSPPRHGMKELIAAADPLRAADIDSWWDPTT